MTNVINSLPFDENELITLLEAARVCMADADTFDKLGYALDLSDAHMINLREKLQKWMEEKEEGEDA